ncbi:unnamed protein product [Rodentolepis nana]|uniref:TP6A_N domain-containing protein n=1 Tax=Rodentolepis nana TaxID=102285 RepID=A0A0R3TLX0_RODNA|nr:unnamed protein product [Rodentolepis nana]
MLAHDVSCSANFVLVIEKDATFQKIMLSDFYGDFQPCLLITSKGYPDLAMRSFLSKLCQKYPKLPMYALVDADPHGKNSFDILKSRYRHILDLQIWIKSNLFVSINSNFIESISSSCFWSCNMCP